MPHSWPWQVTPRIHFTAFYAVKMYRFYRKGQDTKFKVCRSRQGEVGCQESRVMYMGSKVRDHV